MKLKTLSIDSFRGASKPLLLEFDGEKTVTMVFGENGNGKSTITDSLVCLCTDEHGSLDDKSSIDKSFYTSISSKPVDLKIELKTDVGDFLATLSGKNFAKKPAIGHPIVRHLRRSQITQFIEAQPHKRYEQLESFIDVANIAKSEDALRKLNKETEDAQKIAISTLSSTTTTLEQTWENEGNPENNWETWAKKESVKDIAAEENRLKQLEGVITKWNSTKESEAKYKTDIEENRKAKSAKDNVEEEMRKAQEGNENADKDLLSLLESAQSFISAKSEVKNCPVCENTVEKDKLMKSLGSKIESMNSFKKIVLAVKAARQVVNDKQKVLEATASTFIQKIVLIEQAIFTIVGEPFSVMANKLAFIKSTDTTEQKIAEFDKVFAEIDKDIETQKQTVENIKKAIGQHNHIKNQYSSILASREKSESTQKLLVAISGTLKVVEKARKDFVQGELVAISSDVETLYQKLHPNESLGGISLTLKQTTKNSLELSADFYTKSGITPQSVYSESHLDTLGICVFIALAKKYGAANSILILDDVVMSVDENHLDRFIGLLHDEADNFAHIIITTHYRPWKDRYRYNRAPSYKVHFVELRPWSLGNGIRVQNGKLAIDELRQALNDPNYFDRQKITSISGIILENILDYLSVLFQCRVPRKPKNDYQLRELLDSISKALMNTLKVEHLGKSALGKYDGTIISKTVELKTLLNNIKQLAIVRNWVGAHFNIDGSSVSDTDVEQFGKLTLELSQLITCPDSGNFPDRNKSGSYWETKNGSIRLYPLQEPS
jgi:energy-coupling factor transporter ATP-binding protein EcfA2